MAQNAEQATAAAAAAISLEEDEDEERLWHEAQALACHSVSPPETHLMFFGAEAAVLH